MKILSMTATFGKLTRQTLQFDEGLNIIEAHNEWGKSTWCAFLMAMLYGIDTRQQTTKAALADKEHYMPWSGSAMTGQLDLMADGQPITITRSTARANSPMGQFSAVYTGTGEAVPDLNGADIRFEHIRFGYTPDLEILHDIDFTVKAGEMAAIVGPSGSGKSTIINFIPRLWDVKGGRVTIGGVDVTFDEAEKQYFIDGYKLETAVVGVNHLNGKHALNYARLREIDNDWRRIERQREVIISAIDRCRHLSPAQINSLVDTLLPMVKTNIPQTKIAEMLLLVPQLRYVSVQQATIPQEDTYGSMTGLGGRSMFAVDFEANTAFLKEFLYPQIK